MENDMIPDGSAIVTPNQMLDRIDNMSKELHRLATLIDPSLTQLRNESAENRANIAMVDQKVNSNIENVNSKIAQTNEKLSTVNGKIYAMAVAAAAAGAAAGQILSRMIGG